MDQNKVSGRPIISVTGVGSASVVPDIVCLAVTRTDVCPTYAEALAALQASNSALIDALSDAGFERSEIRTSASDIGPKYESCSEDGNFTTRLVGCEYRHSLNITLPLADHAALSRALEAVGASEGGVQTSILYKLSDRKAVRDRLIAEAVADAAHKAEIIARAAGADIDGIAEIVCADSSSNGGIMLMRTAANHADTPEPIELTEAVTVKYYIG